MSTQTSSSIDETSNTLKRIHKYLLEFIERNMLSIKKQQFFMFDHDMKKEKSTSIYEFSLQIQVILKDITKRVEQDYKNYQKTLQFLQEKLRKHSKVQIQFKLYYEHLQEIIEDLKKDRLQFEQKLSQISERYQTQIVNLQTELTQYKNMVTVEQNKSIDGHGRTSFSQKIDTITKIKNRLQCIDTGDYVEERQTLSHLTSKRDSLARQIQQMYNIESKSKPESNQSSLNSSFKKIKEEDLKKNSKSKKKLSVRKNSIENIGNIDKKKEKRIATVKVGAHERPPSVLKQRKSVTKQTFKKEKQP